MTLHFQWKCQEGTHNKTEKTNLGINLRGPKRKCTFLFLPEKQEEEMLFSTLFFLVNSGCMPSAD